ncbi:glycosyltransferase [Hymenobacter sp. BT770]|uniref:glycosyltransferase n=1 Tax=Hymenobacter sp. BT770 TaxID=2886942 RepID=UPI001D10429A|nr:glycosyltransferase [Hymenobacter sp. BT770]MCC3154231.1 glycosyltransferase [Hymenobacter sp. BT770]MDO3416389.1 glycosyltransferase [Hymenobacter sp. BT770]
MTPPEFSVLLLAWDDADPSVDVLGGKALPPTLPLVYQLAAQQPVLAVYPHLPAADERYDEPINPQPKAPATTPVASPTKDSGDAAATDAADETEDETDALSTDASGPGVRLLAGPAAGSQAASDLAVPALQSRIIGLEDLAAASYHPSPEIAAALEAVPTSQPNARSRSQWPTGVNAPQFHQRQEPVAPYVGSSTSAASQGLLVPNPVAGASQSVREAADLAYRAALPPAAVTPPPSKLQPNIEPEAEDTNFDPDPELPTLLDGNAFTEAVEETGPFEAAALSAPEDDITLEALEFSPVVELSASPAFEPEPEAAAPVPRTPAFDGLNFRMIQYARRSAQLVRGRSDFGVIYAPNWPAWLAALEIRNSTGQPLVLYVASLAIDFSSPGDRGWLLEVERMTLRRARIILVPTEDLRQQLQLQYGSTIGEVRVVAAADEDGVQDVLCEVAFG